MILQNLSVSTSEFILIGLALLAVVVFLVVVMSMLLKKNKTDVSEASGAALSMEWQKKLMPLRLQACERLLLLMERIEISSLIKRLSAADLTAPEHQFQLISAIRQEYDYNVAQQLYVSDESWGMVQTTVEQTISTINQIGRDMPTNATGQDLNRMVLNYFLGLKTDSRLSAMRKLKEELWTAW